MNGLRKVMLLVLGMAMIGCAGAAGPPAGAGSARGSGHQILVMLHLPPSHFRPDMNYGSGYGDDISQNARRRVAAELAQAHGLKLVADWPMPVLSVHCFVMEEQANVPPERIARILSRDPRVEWAQPMGIFHGLGHNDPLYPLQPSAKFWHLSELHQIATGRNVHVAVVDSGIEAEHPDLEGQVELMENFVDGTPYRPEMHGTAVAGIIAARADNGIGIEGVAPQARLLALRACWEESRDDTRCNSFTLGKALNAALMRGAQVINLSLTGPADILLQRLLDAALAHRIKIVAAVDRDSPNGGFPASYPGVFAVADESSQASGANAIRRDVLIAPGRNIPTTVPGAHWDLVSGSSFAAAHVSGLVALLTELQPALEPQQAREKLTADSRNTPTAGTIDACVAITRITRTCSCLCATVHAATPDQHS